MMGRITKIDVVVSLVEVPIKPIITGAYVPAAVAIAANPIRNSGERLLKSDKNRINIRLALIP